MRRLLALVTDGGTRFNPHAFVFASVNRSGLERQVARGRGLVGATCEWAERPIEDRGIARHNRQRRGSHAADRALCNRAYKY
jgi:hypothetical protein